MGFLNVLEDLVQHVRVHLLPLLLDEGRQLCAFHHAQLNRVEELGQHRGQGVEVELGGVVFAVGLGKGPVKG